MNIQDQPLVTVYIPTYNRVELLKRAVQSVQQQTYQNLEIIIVDDCSTDGTHEYLARLAKEDTRVRYFLKEKNSGACVSRNIAIKNATGEYITGLDDDDYYLEFRIESFLKNLLKLDKYEFIYTGYIVKNKKGICTNKSDYFKPKIISRRDLLSINYVNNQIFTKTNRLQKFGFNEKLPAWQDLYTWYALLEANKKAYMINEKSYIMDISHEYDRISNAKKDKIFKAYELFCLGHKLNVTQKKILYSQLIFYSEEFNYFYPNFLSLFNSFNIYNCILFKNKLIKRL